MKTYWIVSALSLSFGLFGVQACGGKSATGTKQSNNGGQGSGGQGGNSSSGVAGSGAGPSTHLSQCESLCERTLDVGCTADDASCVMVCATVSGYASCQPQIDDWFECAETSDITCDASGTPAFSDCDNELLLVSACAITTTPPKAVAKSCNDYCAEVDAAGCSGDTQLGECSQTCGITGMVVSACQESFVEFMQCQTEAEVACDENGVPTLTGCESEQLSYLGCVMGNVGQGTQTSGVASAAGGASAIE